MLTSSTKILHANEGPGKKIYSGHLFFSNYLKFKLDFKNVANKWEKVLCFWHNCIWIYIVKLSLLRTGYFLSATNILTSNPKIWHVNKRDFFLLNWLGSDQRCCDADSNNAWARLPCCLPKCPLKRDFLDIYLTTFSESVILEIQSLWRLYFFQNYSNLI